MAYLLLAYFAYLLNIQGPILPFLRDQLRLTYAGVSLHLSAFAAGEIAAGLIGDWVARVFGRWAALWTGAAGMAVGALLLCFGPDFRITLSGCALMGLLGSLQLVLIPAILADRHGEQRVVAVTESNVVASAFSLLAPLSVGAFTVLGLGWRGAVLAAVAFFGIIVASFARVHLPRQRLAGGSERASNRLPQAFWAYCMVIIFVVSVEFCMVLWGTEFLHTILKLPTAQAASAFGLFFAAMLLGRIAGSWFSRRISGRKLIRAALGIAGTGFVLYWVFSSTTVSLTGLFLTGLGIANLYPITLSLAIGVAPGRSDTASARATLAVGTAIMLAPLALGALADALGLQAAHGVVPALLALAWGGLEAADHLARDPSLPR
jgi:fucose permease